MITNGDAWQNDGVGTYPHIVSNDNGIGGNALLVNSFSGFLKVVIECCDGDALCQIDVAADSDRADDGVVYPNAGMVADNDIAHRIVNTAERLHHAVTSQRETAVGRGVHAHGAVDRGRAADRVAPIV